MDERLKKILAVGGFLLSIVAIGAGLYFAFFRPKVTPPAPTIEEQPSEATGLPTAETGRPTPTGEEIAGALPIESVARGGTTATTTLTSSAVESVTIASDGRKANYYDPNDGRFYTIDSGGNVQKLSDQTFPSAQSVSWNPNGNKAIIEFPDGANVVYDFTTQRQVTLPAHWENAFFSPVQDEIIAKSLALDPENRWLVTSNADGSNVRPIQALGENADKVTVSWSPNDQVVAFSDTGDPLSGGLDRQMIIPIGKNRENFKGLTVEGLGFLPNWSPSGKQLLYSVSGDYSESKPLLWVVDGTPGSIGDGRRSLGLNTWADKCTYADETTLFCAVPTYLPPNAGLSRTLFRNTPDNLYRVDLTSGRSTLVAIPAEPRIMENLSVTSDAGLLYFTDAETGRLETILLK